MIRYGIFKKSAIFIASEKSCPLKWCMVAPQTSYPASCNKRTTNVLSIPPDMATTTFFCVIMLSFLRNAFIEIYKRLHNYQMTTE